MNKINIYINEKNKLLKKLENLNDKIIFYDTIINAIQNGSENFYKNINVKHVIYGEDINLTKVYKDKPIQKVKKIIKLDDIINKNFIDLIKNKNELNLLYKKTEDDFLFSLFNNNLFDIIKQNGNIIKEDSHIQKTTPTPPLYMPKAIPAKLPTPILAARDKVSVLKGDIPLLSPCDFLKLLIIFLKLNCTNFNLKV